MRQIFKYSNILMNTMNFDISLGLGLGLGLHEQRHKQSKKIKEEEEEDPCNKVEPYSLTLGVGSAADNIDERNIHHQVATTTKTESDDFIYNLHQRASNSTSVMSSFSNSSNSIKRERNEVHEPEKISFVDVDDVNDNPIRKKLRLTKEQSAVLEDTFKDHSTLNPKQKQELASKLNLGTRQVEVWFQNRRARTKVKQTEVDCEALKHCYETLTEENRRLEEELKELKSMKTVNNYMQLPVASLTACPSCKRICTGTGTSDENGSSHTTALILCPKAQIHFYANNNNYTFTQSSATIAS